MSHIEELARAKKERATRGKYAEGKVRDFLKKVSDGVAAFDFSRLPDARSAGGNFRFQRQPADFEFFMPSGHGLIEVKQVEHDCRLPRKNFDPTRWGGMRKREMAGGKIIIAVYHTTTKLWRFPTFEFFKAHKDAASWDLSDFNAFEKCEGGFYFYGITVPRC